MSSDPTITPPPVDTPQDLPEEREIPQVGFSGARWSFTGIVRVAYRRWTGMAVRLFPEESKSARIARALHIPLPDRLNMSWVTKHLAVGGRIRPEDIAAVARAGITHVVDTRSEYRDDEQALAKEHIELLYLPTRDTQAMSVEQLMEGAQWVHQRMEQEGRVLIHCEHGVGRSVLLGCAVLVYGGMHAQDALKLVKNKRLQDALNHKQVKSLGEFRVALWVTYQAT